MTFIIKGRQTKLSASVSNQQVWTQKQITKTVDMATNNSGSGSNGGYPSSLKCLFCQASVRFEGLPATLYEIHLSKLIFFSTQRCSPAPSRSEFNWFSHWWYFKLRKIFQLNSFSVSIGCWSNFKEEFSKYELRTMKACFAGSSIFMLSSENVVAQSSRTFCG